MEVSGGVGGGISGDDRVVGSDAPSEHHIAPITENSAPGIVSTAPIPASQGTVSPPVPAELTAEAAVTTVPEKKKRGRPRKYALDGSVLSPKPISSAAPMPAVIDFTAEKRGKVKPNSVSNAKFEIVNLGKWVACSIGANFTPHIINVNAGEDVTMKVISFSQQGYRTICILSANGVISSVTLRQPDSSGGTLTYEGRFEILSLSGSFMPSDGGGTRSRSGGMSVCLASPDGRVIGGGVAGLLVAATPVQVVVGSFLAGNRHDQKPKKQKHEVLSTVTPAAIVPISTTDPIPFLASTPSFRGNSWSAVPADATNKQTDCNATLPGG